MRKVLYFLLTLILIVIGVFDFAFAANYLTRTLRGETVRDGVIDLSNRDIDGGDFAYLTGDWEFYWNKLIITDALEDTAPDLTVNVPSFWSDYSIGGKQLENGGFASYRLKLKGVYASRPIIVCVPNLPAAYKVFIDRQLVYTGGKTSKDGEQVKAIPIYTAYPVTLNTYSMPEREAELVIEVSCELSSGITMTPILVNYETYFSYAMFMLGVRYVFAGIILLAGIFVFIMSKRIKSENAYSAWLSLLCVSLIVRIIISNEGFLASTLLFFGLTYELMHFIIFVSTFIIKLLLFLYTSKSLSLKLPQNIILLFGVFFLVYASVPVLFTNYIFNPAAFVLLQMSTFVFDAYIIYQLCGSITDKTRGAILYTVGYISVIVGLHIDVLYAGGYISARVSWFMPLMFLVFIGTAIYMQISLAVDSYNKSSRAAELSKELSEINMSLMLSQIQPHFLYNALNTIKYLTKKDPKSAESAIVSFSNYLRANMDSLSQREPVPFEDELNHIRNYAAIEMLRFEDRLNIVYDIRCTSFKLPALTIQPLVENAIKHGVNQKADGGTVTISSYEDKKNFYVCVVDDGVGYDIKTLPPNSRSHIGLANITSRLKFMLGADIRINSRLGYGTEVLITIPKNKKSVLTEGD